MCTRWGWPTKVMPNISHASRSCQLAPGYTGTQVAIDGSSSGTSTLRVMPWPASRLLTPGEHLDAGVAARVARHRRDRLLGRGPVHDDVLLAVHVAPEGRGQPVDRREEVEVGATRACPSPPSPASRHDSVETRTQRSSPGRMCEPTRASPSSGAQRLEQRLAPLVDRRSPHLRSRWPRPRCLRPQPTTIESPRQRAAMSSFWMCSCSSRMPSSRASGRGGQPGT